MSNLQPPDHEDAFPRKPKEQSWESWIDELIRDAQERGEFDNLPGKGKPLSLRRNPYLAEERQLAYDLVQNTGHTLPWIDEAKEIERRITAAREKLRRDYAWYRIQQSAAKTVDLLALEKSWHRQRALFEKEVDAINRLIDVYNLKAPSVQLQKPRLILAEELANLEKEA